MFSFDSFLTNVGYISRGGVTPATVDRTANDNVFGFQFNTVGVNTGQFSHFLVIETNRSNYTSGLFSSQDGSAGTGAAFQPSAVTPALLAGPPRHRTLRRRCWPPSQALPGISRCGSKVLAYRRGLFFCCNTSASPARIKKRDRTTEST